MRHAELTDRLAAIVSAAPGDVSVAVRGWDGFRWDHDSTRVVPAASTVKVPILLAYLESGMPWDLPITLPERRVGGCGPLSLLPSVRTLPAGELLRLMIALSDNDATNAILGVVGYGGVSRLLTKARARHTEVRRPMMDPAAVAAGRDNVTTAANLAEILASLRAGVLVDHRSAAMALAVMREQQFRDGLAAYLPEDVHCASKTGMLAGIRHDIAIIERDQRWVVVTALGTRLMQEGIDRGTAILPSYAALGEAVTALL